MCAQNEDQSVGLLILHVHAHGQQKLLRNRLEAMDTKHRTKIGRRMILSLRTRHSLSGMHIVGGL